MIHNKTYIIAEIGINFNGKLDNCYKMIDIAAEAGCNAAKFQFFSAKNMYPRSAGKLDWKDDHKEYSYDIYKAVESFELPSQWLDKLMARCASNQIDFMSSVFGIEEADYLYKNGITNFKIASYVITHIPLIDFCASKKIPIYLSTGGARIGEIEEAVEAIAKYHDNLALLHCSIKYPTELKECNMGVIDTLRYVFPELTLGYSDHTAEIHEAPVQAIYLGAKVIEKHITIDKKMDGPDHFFALEPQELKTMVSKIREAEKDKANGAYTINPTIYGSTAKKVNDHEKYLRDFAFTCIFAGKNIKKGEVIKSEDLKILRPGQKERGLMPKYIHLFQNNKVIAACDISFEKPIMWSDLFDQEG